MAPQEGGITSAMKVSARAAYSMMSGLCSMLSRLTCAAGGGRASGASGAVAAWRGPGAAVLQQGPAQPGSGSDAIAGERRFLALGARSPAAARPAPPGRWPSCPRWRWRAARTGPSARSAASSRPPPA
jgi:hypothetical protein